MDIADRHNRNQDSIDGSHMGLSVGVENRIKGDYFRDFFYFDVGSNDLTIDDIWIETYYGTYGRYSKYSSDDNTGLIAVMVDFKDSGYTCEEREIVIAEILFHYNSGNSIIVWSPTPRTFYTLQEAYDQGLLTREDLSTIADRL